MIVHLLRSPEYSKSDFKKVVELLQSFGNSIRFINHANIGLNYNSTDNNKAADEFFNICKRWRTTNSISNDDYVFMLTEYGNSDDFFSWTNETLGDYFIQTSEWDKYFDKEKNKHFPISYEVVASILRSLMYDTQEEILENAHQRARGCVMDFCDDKVDIILKMRTGDVCNDCLKRISQRGVNTSFLGNIFNTMEGIRKGLMFRNRNEIIGRISPLRIHLGKNRPKLEVIDANNLKLSLNDLETAIYLVIIQSNGLRINELSIHQESLKDYYRVIKNGNIDPKDLSITIRSLVDTDNKSAFYQKISKINAKIRKQLGEDLSKSYLIQSKNGLYSVRLNSKLLDIQNNPF